MTDHEQRGATVGQPLSTMAILAMLMAFASISTDMYLPAMRRMAIALAAMPGRLEWTILGYLIGFCLGQLVWGPLSDRLGRRLPIAFGLVLFLAGAAGFALADAAGTLIGWRVVQAIGASASLVIGRAIVRDLYRGVCAAQLMSTLMTVMALAPLLGPSVGSLILRVASWWAIFWTLAAVTVLTLLAASTLAETLAKTARTRKPLSAASAFYMVRCYAIAPCLDMAASQVCTLAPASPMSPGRHFCTSPNYMRHRNGTVRRLQPVSPASCLPTRPMRACLYGFPARP